MPNPVKGEIALDLAPGKRVVMVFDMEALCRAEDAYGHPLKLLMERVQGGFLGAIRILFWAAMQRHQPDTTMADVDALLTEHGDAIEKMLTAYEKAMPAVGEGKDGKNPRLKASGGNGAKPGSNRANSGTKPRARSR